MSIENNHYYICNYDYLFIELARIQLIIYNIRRMVVTKGT